MTTQAEIETKFWKALKSDRTLMLGLSGAEDGRAQPMTAQIEDDEGGPVWIFTAKSTDLVKAMTGRHKAFANFVSKDHEVFAAIEGELVADNDAATIDRLWNPFVAAWFEGGREDPQLQLLRFDASQAQIWLNEHSLIAGVKMLLGRDPKEDYKDKVAEVNLA